MEVRVGVIHSHKELSIEVDDAADDISAKVDAAMANDDSVLWLDDRNGERVGIAVDKIAYVELMGTDGKSQVGFGGG
ncbi:MAG: DUF3107 domain-containing protein [Acidimicrobiia bacterium]